MWRPIPLENSIGFHDGEWWQMAFYDKPFPEPWLGRAVANFPPKPSLPEKTRGTICVHELHLRFTKTTCSCRAGTQALCGNVGTNVLKIWTIDFQNRIHTWSIFSLGKRVVRICSRKEKVGTHDNTVYYWWELRASYARLHVFQQKSLPRHDVTKLVDGVHTQYTAMTNTIWALEKTAGIWLAANLI